MDTFLNKHHLLKLNKDNINNLNIYNPNKIESSIKSLQPKNSPLPDEQYSTRFSKKS